MATAVVTGVVCILSLRNPDSSASAYVLGWRAPNPHASRWTRASRNGRKSGELLAPQELVIYQLTYADPMVGSGPECKSALIGCEIV